MNNDTAAFLQRRQHRKARHTAQRQARCRARRRAAAACPSRGPAVRCARCQTIHPVFPQQFDPLRQWEDCRQKSDDPLAEMLRAGIRRFVFRPGSRNAFNNQRAEAKFRTPDERWFQLRLPHLDTVHQGRGRRPAAEWERLKPPWVKTRLEKQVLHPYRLFGRGFVVAVDATGGASFSERHGAQCLHRTSSTGKTTDFHPVVEAQRITPSGWAIAWATEGIAHPTGEYDQPDGERKAVVRWAAPLKQQDPRLPLGLTADGRYPDPGVFEICRDSGWALMIPFQAGHRPTVWEDGRGVLPRTPAPCRPERRDHGSTVIEPRFRWVHHRAYGGHPLAGRESVEAVTPANGENPTHHRWVHRTHLTVTARTVATLSHTGR